MTHSVVIHDLMVSWYPKRRPSNATGDVLTIGGPLVWLRWLKKPMKPSCLDHNVLVPLPPKGMHDGAFLCWWWPWNPCWVMELLHDDDDHVWSLTCYGTLEYVLGMMKKPHEELEPMMKTLMPLQRSWSPLLAWWHDEGTHTHVMTLGHL